MKFSKAEKIWLISVLVLFVCYNLPFVPRYDHPLALLIHGAVTLIPLWIAVYVGLFKVTKNYGEKNNKGTEQNSSKEYVSSNQVED